MVGVQLCIHSWLMLQKSSYLQVDTSKPWNLRAQSYQMDDIIELQLW